MANTLLDDLKASVENRQAVFVVGAGVSIHTSGNAPCASWRGLLHDGAERCAQLRPDLGANWLEKVKADTDSDDLDDMLAAATKITSKLGPPEYSRWLRESVGALQVCQADVLEALRDLEAPIATTNYDSLIEDVAKAAPATWQEGAKVERVLRGDERGILHLHGAWEEPESVVLGIRSYENVLGNEHAQTVLHSLAMMKTLIFVGFGAGLQDPNFKRFLDWTGTVFATSEYRRYRLACESERDKLQAEHPPEQRLYVVSHGATHEDLAPFLRDLNASRRSRKPVARATPGPGFQPLALPPKPRCFGREVELAGLVANLLMDNPEPTPILGGPCVGKSTLAVAAILDERVAARYGARRWFIRCDGITSRSALSAEIAQTIGVAPAQTVENDVLVELASAPGVLVLDSAEFPWEADQLAVEDLFGRIAGTPGLAFMITLTSNERPGGVNWREAFLPAPLDANAARQVFLSIAGKKHESDARLDLLLDAVDRLPLAVTLLAHEAEAEPDLEELWRRWQHKSTAMLVRAGGKDRLSNLDLSYEIALTSKRMTPEGLRLLQTFALLPAGVRVTDLPGVMPSSESAAASTLRRTGLAFDEAGRLRILAPLRKYMQESHPPDEEDVSRVVRFYSNLAIESGSRVGAKTGGEAVQRLTPEATNIEQIILRGLSSPDADLAVRAAIAFSEFICFTGRITEESILAAAEYAEGKGHMRDAATCRSKVADVALARSRYDEAGKGYETARTLYRKVGDVLGEADCIKGLGNIALARSEHDEAGKRYEEALPLFRQVNNVPGEADCIRSLGDIELARSAYGEARKRYEAAQPLYRKVGDVLGEANCIYSLGDVALARSANEEARKKYEEALPLYRQVGDVLGEANSIKRLGDMALAKAANEEARKRYEEALPLYRQVSDVLGEANCIQKLGDLALARAAQDEALAKYEQAVSLYERIPDPCSIGWAHVRLARLAGTSQARIPHITAAREAWKKIGRTDLIERLVAEFGSPGDFLSAGR